MSRVLLFAIALLALALLCASDCPECQTAIGNRVLNALCPNGNESPAPVCLMYCSDPTECAYVPNPSPPAGNGCPANQVPIVNPSTGETACGCPPTMVNPTITPGTGQCVVTGGAGSGGFDDSDGGLD
eukprot:TRINITY_DN8145_c0_g1_i1.p2 TRINITY_DN8145_c0_g1~~TRINITY_DN8145_c0_g1_i1.p2  ORF type:complete len:128 (-),score=10.21 TRINITY_DN8145_c0_g1_i1:58-441(-)